MWRSIGYSSSWLLFVLALALGGCSGAATSLTSQPAPPASASPAAGAVRQAASAYSGHRRGADYDSSFPHLYVSTAGGDGLDLLYSPPGNWTASACYWWDISGAGEVDTVTLSWTSAPSFCAMSVYNFATSSWVPLSASGVTTFTLHDMEQYKNSSDNHVEVVVFTPFGNSGQLYQIAIDDNGI